MKFKKCLIASDFDGTFYDDNGSVPSSNIDAIRYFISEGGNFTISTGRVQQGFNRYSPEYINTACLVGNGAAAYDYEKKRYNFISGIGMEGCFFVRSLMEKFPNMSIEIYSPYDVYCINMSENTQSHFTSQMFNFKQIEYPEQSTFPWVKVMLDADDISLEVQEYIRSFCSDPGFLPTTGGFVEVLKKGVNKGTGLLRLADSLDIPYDRVFSVGDGYNDVDMLKAAKLGFAPANSSKEALDAADRIVCSNNDGAIAGVIEFLEKVL